MVDGELETLDLILSKRGIVRFASGFFVDDSDSFSIFSIIYNFFNFGGEERWLLWGPYSSRIFKNTTLTDYILTKKYQNNISRISK